LHGPFTLGQQIEIIWTQDVDQLLQTSDAFVRWAIVVIETNDSSNIAAEAHDQNATDNTAVER